MGLTIESGREIATRLERETGRTLSDQEMEEQVVQYNNLLRGKTVIIDRNFFFLAATKEYLGIRE